MLPFNIYPSFKAFMTCYHLHKGILDLSNQIMIVFSFELAFSPSLLTFAEPYVFKLSCAYLKKSSLYSGTEDPSVLFLSIPLRTFDSAFHITDMYPFFLVGVGIIFMIYKSATEEKF